MNYQYSKIGNFGNTGLISDPLTYSLSYTVDTSFNHPVAPDKFTGPRARNVQLFMAQRCADNWDGYCDFASANQSKSFPNQALQFGNNTSVHDLSLGEAVVGSAAQRRFCTYPNCEKKWESFDPTVANSPNIYYYTDNSGEQNSCVPVCRVNPQTIDDDKLMNKVLSNPKAAMDTLVNICNTSRREGTDLSGTRIGKFCEAYHQLVPKPTANFTPGNYQLEIPK